MYVDCCGDWSDLGDWHGVTFVSDASRCFAEVVHIISGGNAVNHATLGKYAIHGAFSVTAAKRNHMRRRFNGSYAADDSALYVRSFR